jgi:hypothetical protein
MHVYLDAEVARTGRGFILMASLMDLSLCVTLNASHAGWTIDNEPIAAQTVAAVLLAGTRPFKKAKP